MATRKPTPKSDVDDVEPTPEDIVDFLADKGGPSGRLCPFCRTDDWGVMDYTDGKTPSILVHTDDMRKPVEFHAVIGLICGNCGRIQFHSMDTIKAWKRKRVGK